MTYFHGNGKLLLTAEYVVLSGAKALALPTLPGQSLQVLPSDATGNLYWTSRDHTNAIWFEATFRVSDWTAITTTDPQVSDRLQQIFTVITSHQSGFADQAAGQTAQTQLEFPRNWGLGTSSTLIDMLAEWSGVNPWTLLNETFGGSGYDLAAARADGPFLYWLDEEGPQVQSVSFNPSFSDQLYFVYLERKQNSREGIARYRERAKEAVSVIPRINKITEELLQVDTLDQFEKLLTEHEVLLSDLLGLPRIKEDRFADFPGCIKSLGAWGGDFVLATSAGMSAKQLADWFSQRGYPTIRSYTELIRQREA